jgi:hypothetical protein
MRVTPAQGARIAAAVKDYESRHDPNVPPAATLAPVDNCAYVELTQKLVEDNLAMAKIVLFTIGRSTTTAKGTFDVGEQECVVQGLPGWTDVKWDIGQKALCHKYAGRWFFRWPDICGESGVTEGERDTAETQNDDCIEWLEAGGNYPLPEEE